MPPATKHPLPLVGRYISLQMFLFLMLSVGMCSGLNPVSAQSGDDLWGAPVNLSESGAASQPVILPQPERGFRVFWWDQFDGVTMVEGTLQAWSDPVVTPIQVVNRLERPTADGRVVELVPIAAMPTIYGDLTGRAHAFWLGEVDEETGATPLMLARLESSSTRWTTPRELTETAVGIDVTADVSDTLHLVYIRALSSSLSPSGFYYLKSADGGVTWSQSVQVHASRYYRLLSSEDAYLDVEVVSPETVTVTWNDPHSEVSFVTQSVDGGATWRDPVSLGSSQGKAQYGRLVVTAGEASPGVHVLWQDTSLGVGCALYQAAVADLYVNQDAASRVLDELAACSSPRNTHFAQIDRDQTLMLSSSEGSGLTLVVWNGTQWSEPRSVSVNFEEPNGERSVALVDLYPVLVSTPLTDTVDTEEVKPELPLVVVGTDEGHDVWAVSTQMDVLDIVFAPPSPWLEPESLSEGSVTPGLPAAVTDSEGRLHLLWAESERADGGESVLRYARRDNGRWARPTTVLRSPDGGATAPVLVVQGAYLHALWSGGPSGHIWYSRAFLQDAYATSGWRAARLLPELSDLSEALAGSHPDLVSLGGVLHAVFAVPVNEGRGIYYTYSEDEGETWAAAVQVFDAVAAGWATADNPTLAVDYQGGLHVVWERPALSPSEPSEGVVYAWSGDRGETWTEPNVVAEGDFGHSEVMVSAPWQVHLLWQDTSGVGTWWHRWSVGDAEGDLGDQGDWDRWTRPEQIVGLGRVPGPLGLVADGAGRLHLLGWRDLGESQPKLVHTLWSEARWEQQDALSLAFLPSDSGVSASLQPETGQLSVILSGAMPSDDEAVRMGLWYTGRVVSQAETLPVVAVTVQPTPTPTPTPLPGPTMTPTPMLDGGPPPSTGGLTGLPLALLLGGGLAALIVFSVSGVRLLRAERF